MINKQFLLSRILNILEGIFSDIIIISGKPELYIRFPDQKFLPDIHPGCGPLGGIYTALSRTRQKSVFVFACDMPNLQSELIRKQLDLFRKNQPDILIPRHQQGIEPLHAIYSRNCLPRIKEQLNKNDCAVRSFFPTVQVDYFDLAAGEEKYFFNINTIKELASLRNGRLSPEL